MVPTWQLGDEVVTLNSRRYGVVVGVDDALKVRVKFEDESELYSTHYATHYESEMNVLRARLTSLRSFVLANFRTFVQNNEVKEEGWRDHKHLNALLELIDLTEKIRNAGVDLDDVAQFFDDSERTTAFKVLDAILSVDVAEVHVDGTHGDEVITRYSSFRNYQVERANCSLYMSRGSLRGRCRDCPQPKNGARRALFLAQIPRYLIPAKQASHCFAKPRQSPKARPHRTRRAFHL